MAGKIGSQADKIVGALKDFEKGLDSTDKKSSAVFKKYDKNIKKSKKNTDALADSFKTFRKVLEGISSKGFADTMDDMPNYIKGVSKLTTSFSSYTKEVEKTSSMMSTMGINYSKAMKELDVKSAGVSKSMGNLVTKANKLASLKDSLIDVPKKLKEIQDSMGDTPTIDTKNIEQLNGMLNAVKGNISDVDFEELQGKIGKLGSGVDSGDMAKSIQEKLNSVEVSSDIIGGAGAAKENIDAISAEINKLQSLKPGDAVLNEFLSSMQEMKKDASLSDVLGKHASEISEFEKALASPEITYQEVVEKITALNEQLGGSMGEFFEGFKGHASEFAADVNTMRKENELLADSMRDGYDLTFHTDEAVAEFQGALADLSSKAYMIQARNIIPDEQLMKTKEIQEGMRNLRDLNEENRQLADEITNSEGKSAEAIAKMKSDQGDINKKIKTQVSSLRKMEKLSSEYADNMLKGSEAGFGEDKAKDLGGKLERISGSIGRMGAGMGADSKIGKGLGFLSKAAGKFGGKLKGLGFPIALVTGAVAATKALLKMETQFHAMNKEALQTGGMANVTGNVTSAFKDLNSKLNNTKGLMSASFGGKEFALGREDIVGMTNALRDGGVQISNLKKGMEGVHTTAAAVSNEYLNAANMVSTFATELGVAPGAIAQSIGEMTYDYNENLGGIRDTYAEIATASKNSGMSQTRFLASVQTATAGLSIYESQVGAVSKIIAGLGKEENITGKAATNLAKNMSEFSQNSQNVMIGFSQMSTGQKDSMREAVAADIARIKSKKKLTAEDKNQLKISEKFLANAGQKGTDGGDWDTNAAAQVKYMGASAQTEVYAASFDKLIDSSQGNLFAMEEMASEFGLSKEAVQAAVKSSGGDAKLIVQTLRDKAREALNKQGDFAKQVSSAQGKSVLTGDPRNKLIQSLKNELVNYTGPALKYLMAISSAAGVWGALSGIMSIFAGSGGLITAVTAASTAIAAVGAATLGLMAGLVVGITTAIYAGMAKYLQSENEKSISVGKKSGGAVLDHGSKRIKEREKQYASLVENGKVAEAAAMKEKIEGLKKVQEANKKTQEDAIADARKGFGMWDLMKGLLMGPEEEKVPSMATGGYVNKTGLVNLHAGEVVTNASDTSRSKVTGAVPGGGRQVSNHNTFNINGGNPQEVESVILNVLNKHEKQKT